MIKKIVLFLRLIKCSHDFMFEGFSSTRHYKLKCDKCGLDLTVNKKGVKQANKIFRVYSGNDGIFKDKGVLIFKKGYSYNDRMKKFRQTTNNPIEIKE